MSWQNERMENLIHVHDREERRDAIRAAEDAGELDDRPTLADSLDDTYCENWDDDGDADE